MPWWVVTEGGAADLALYGSVVALGTLAAVVLMSPHGDRWPKRTQIIASTAMLAVAAAACGVLALRGHYQLAPLLGLGLLSAGAGAVLQPACATIAAELVAAQRLPDVLGLQKTAQSLGRIGGPLLGGLLIAWAGAPAALMATPMLMGAATLAAFAISASPAEPRHPPPVESWFAALRAGWKAKWSVPLERGWTGVNFLVWIFVGPAVTMMIPLKVASLGLSGAWLGAAEAALSVGMLLGALSSPQWLVQRIGRFRARTGAAMSEGLLLAVAGGCSSPTLLLAALLCTGFTNSTMALVGQAHRTLAIPPAFRVRMMAVNQMSTQIASALGPMLVALSLQHAPLPWVYVGFGLMASLCAAGFCGLPRASEFLALDHDAVRGWYGREYPQAFGERPSPPPGGC